MNFTKNSIKVVKKISGAYMILYIATKNQGKIKEINEIMKDVCIECRPYPNMEEIEETGLSFEENAKIKADYLSNKLKDVYVIADDSGLMIEALNGEPGIYSARYAMLDDKEKHNNSDDKANNQKVLNKMKGVKNRECKFVCVIALSKNGKTIKTFYGELKGYVGQEEKGDNGFGYDSIFCLENGKTTAELESSEKNKISHRYKALELLKNYICEIL